MSEVTLTYLQMKAPSELRGRSVEDLRFAVREATVRQWQFNRFLYLLVGGSWSWTDKCQWNEEQWQEYLASDSLRTFVASYDGSVAGYYELLRGADAAVQIVYFGLTSEFIGRGFGAALLTDAIKEAWAWDARRVWVHTCSRDHPSALKNYQARGMQIYDCQTFVTH